MIAIRKTTFTILASFFTVLLITASCSQPDPNLPLPERNDEVKEYFTLLDTLVTEYCVMAEDLVEASASLDPEKNGGKEPTFSDGLSLLKTMGTSALKISKLAKEIEKMEEDHPEFEKDLTEKDFEEFMDIYTKMIKRFYDLGKKMEAIES